MQKISTLVVSKLLIIKFCNVLKCKEKSIYLYILSLAMFEG